MKKIYDETEERAGEEKVDGLYDAILLYLCGR